MKQSETTNNSEILRLLPSVDALLQTEGAQKLAREIGAKHLTTLARTASDDLRSELRETTANGAGEIENYSRENLLEKAEKRLLEIYQSGKNAALRRVINATGVIVHTNLGRAPLSQKAREAIINQAAGYCTLEYDLETGKRGRRGANAEQILAQIVGAESALIVNNCAAAAFLVLTVLARGGEVVISRGELVEIGGDFRVPDVMEQSGAILREVGATNRTRLSDYENVINENTKLILRVHPSNYRIVGFTAAPDLSQLAELAHRHDILLYEDAGSGAIFDLSRYGLADEPIISHSISAGADVITFSGDKLLGGAQSGLIVGRREIVERLRKHPLYRALRVDKLIYAALEATLQTFRRENALREIPVLLMLSMTETDIQERIENFAARLREKHSSSNDLKFEIIKGNSVIGGGSAPMVQPATTLLALHHEKMSIAKLEQSLRLSEPPVVTRILDGRVLIDLRTVSESEESELLEILAKI